VFLDNILAASYKTYGRYKYETPYFSSVIYLSACLMINTGNALYACKLIWGIDLFISTTVWLTGCAVLTISMFRYYDKARVANILAKYETKSKRAKLMWGIFAFSLMAFPVFIIFFVF